jgi:hypothetical protein
MDTEGQLDGIFVHVFKFYMHHSVLTFGDMVFLFPSEYYVLKSYLGGGYMVQVDDLLFSKFKHQYYKHTTKLI